MQPTRIPSRQGEAYDRGTIALHWLTAGIVLGLWLVGQFLESLVPKGPLRADVWSAHFDVGLVLAALIVALPLWRRTGGRKLPDANSGPLHLLAKTVHASLYMVLAVTIGLGIANAFVRGAHLFGSLALPQVGDPSWRHPLTHWHGLAANILMALALFHAVAALIHHYLWHDTVLRRMIPGRA